MKKINPKKPTVVCIESAPNSGAEYAVAVVQSYLKEIYGDKFQKSDCRGLFEIDADKDDRRVKMMDGVMTYIDHERFEDPHNEVGSRLWHINEQIIKEKKSFAFYLYPGLFHKTAHDLLGELKRKYNVVIINLHTINTFTALDGVKLSEIDYHLMFKFFKQAYTINNDYPSITYDELSEDPFTLIRLFADDVDVTLSVDAELIKKQMPVTPKAYTMVHELLNRYGIKHAIGKSNEPIYASPITKHFDINEDIPGWTSLDKLYYLAVVARFLPRNSTIVELGTWVGRSTYVLANNRRDSSVKLKCYDFLPKKGGTLLSEIMAENPFEGKFRKTDRYGLKLFKRHVGEHENMEIYTGDLDEQILDIEEDSVDALFADAGHTYEDTKKYLDTMHSRMKKGGIIVVDDYNNHDFPDASRAVDEYAEENGLTLNTGERYGCDDLAIIIKK
jgi:predicted O-methyltransferase YrrM